MRTKLFICACLIFLAGFSVCYLALKQPNYWYVYTALTAVFTIYIFIKFYKFAQNRPQQRIDAIQKIAAQIEDEINTGLQIIDAKNAPKEVLPLINAINNLVLFFEDRYVQERDFTANASHELRTPLAGIRIQTEIAMAAKEPEQIEKAHRGILKAVDRGTRLVEQLLILSRLTADKVELDMEAVNIGKLTSRVVAELITMAESKNTNLHIAHFDELYVDGNRDSLAIMINNIIRNSITYCPNNSNIEIQIRKDLTDNVTLTIDDNGVGIPKNKREFVL